MRGKNKYIYFVLYSSFSSQSFQGPYFCEKITQNNETEGEGREERAGGRGKRGRKILSYVPNTSAGGSPDNLFDLSCTYDCHQ
jgi:hypothetical protein